MGTRLDRPTHPSEPVDLAAQVLSPEELHRWPNPQQQALQNMLSERLRRQPPPSPQELQGIKQLATPADDLLRGC